MSRRVILLGSTGSIGTQTVDVVEHLARLAAAEGRGPELAVVALAAGRNATLLAQQARQLNVKHVAIAHEPEADALRAALPGVRVLAGPDAAERLVREVECEVVVAAMVGAAGLPATLAAVELGRDVALANKETLVAAGELILPAARASGSRLLPVDSEHAAVWQCLQGPHNPSASPVPPLCCGPEVSRVILTASGGALRNLSAEQAYHASAEQALAHPTWSMGAKVTLDSASLTNKAFEVIEAHWLFGLEAERIGVLIHPQSIVHALVEYADGNVIAHLGSPDMRGPIQYALTYPHRPRGNARKLDFRALRSLDFAEPDPKRFPALGLAYHVIRTGGTSGATLNAASEEATLAFLASHQRQPALAGAAPAGAPPMPFGKVAELAAEALGALPVTPVRSLADVLAADQRARAFVRAALE
jgi:1-deoxy-D-xylulose-5-phosphate reductoisomerase